MKFLCIIALFSTLSCADIPVVGVDQNGDEVSDQISQDDLIQSINFALDESEKIIDEKMISHNNNFFLEKISIGFGAQGDIGLGPFSVGTGLRQRYIFKRAYK